MATKLAIISDLHHFSKTLGTAGRAYELRSGSDQKALAESGDVIDSVFRTLGESDVDAVLIVGDITNDGERASHEEMREKLRALRLKKPVYLITSTHDWCTDGNARRYVGAEVFHDVETVGGEELADYYDEFGKENEISRYKTDRGFYSRCFQVSDDLRLLAVNDDMDGEGGRSGYSPAHLNWMREQLAAAKKAGQKIIAMEHHLLLYNLSPLINKGQSISNNYETAEALADAGLKLIFVGHSHMLRTTEYATPAGNKITQINVGALCGYPAPVNRLTMEGPKAYHKVEFLDGFMANGAFADKEFFRQHTANVLLHLVNAAASGNKQDTMDRLGAHGIRLKESLYPVLHIGAKKLQKLTVGRAGRLVNCLTLGKGVDRAAVKALKNDRLLPYVIDLFLCVFDGSESAKALPDAAKTIARDVGTLPGRVVSKLPVGRSRKESIRKITGQIEALVFELVDPAGPDNIESVIEL